MPLSVATGKIGDMEFLAWLVVGIALGGGAVWLVLRAQAGSWRAEQAAEVEKAKADAADARTRAAEAASEVVSARAGAAAAAAERDAAVLRAREIADDRAQLLTQFRALSAETIEAQERRLDASAELRMKATEQLLTPVRETLQQFHDRINDVERQRVAMASELRTQVAEVRQAEAGLRKETAALVTALRKPQVRGAWGELQLKRVVELAGMIEHCDFELQQTTQTSAGTTIRPDLKVMLSEDRYLYVDSKVPLAAFLEAHETDDASLRAEKLALFARNVLTHVDQLGGKDYFKAGGSTPEYVVLFLASEALAAEAFQQIPALHEYAAARNVVIATPSSLIALLKAVSYAWKQVALAESAQEVYELGRELYDRLGALGGHFDKVGRGLTSVVKAYNDAVGSIESRVFPSARRFRDLRLSDKELGEVHGVDANVRLLTAPELIEDAAGVAPMIGRARSADELLVRAQPELDDLLGAEAAASSGSGARTA